MPVLRDVNEPVVKLSCSGRIFREATQELWALGLTVLSGALVCAAVYNVAIAPYWDYNAHRLLPAFLLKKGMTLFPARHSGFELSTLYGPVTSVTYLPATLAHTPNAAVLIGSLLTAVLCFSAMLLLHLRVGAGGRRLTWLAFVTTGLFVCLIESTRYSCFSIHADGVALFYGMLAVAAATWRKSTGETEMICAACLASLSVWAKQPLVGVALGLAAYYLLSTGVKAAIRFSAYAVASASVLGAIFSAAWGWRELALNLLVLPAHHSWKHSSRLLELMYSYRTFAIADMFLVAPLAAYVLHRMVACEGRWSKIREETRGKPWVAAMLVGVCLIPLSLVSLSKTGGDVNNLSFCTLFLLLACTLLLQELAGSGEKRVASFALLVMVCSAAMCATLEAPLVVAAKKKLRELPSSDQNVVFLYMQRHPGDGYFPWFPTAQVLADGNVYNGVSGLRNRVQGGDVPTDAEFRQHIPAGAKFLAFAANHGPWAGQVNFMAYLPEFLCATTSRELPGFTLYYTRESAKAAGFACVVQPPADPEEDTRGGGME